MEEVKKLRDMTGAGVMDCKKALEATEGDFAKAVEILKQKGIASAAKRADREAKEGLIAVGVEGDKGAMVEVNCETDFVARTDDFKNVTESFLKKAFQSGEKLASSDEAQNVVREFSGKVGEKIVFRRSVSLESKGGFISSYLHSNKKIGILVAMEGGKGNESATQAGKDIAMQVAAARPSFVSRQEINAEILERQKDLFRVEVKDKPAQIQEKILDGKIAKWYEQACLLEQPFIKNEDQKVRDYLAEISKKTGQPVAVRSFIRFELGG